jgi:hypothetical protein
MKVKLLAAVLVLFAAILAGCAGGSYYSGVRYGPPAPRYRVIGVAPGPGYVWTHGYWDLRRNNWHWIDGRWMRPPRPRARWVSPEWRYEQRRWRFNRGYWR